MNKAPSFLTKIAPEYIYRAINQGACCMVGGAHKGEVDLMPAAFNCAVDLVPAKLTVVIDKTHYTRTLVEKNAYFSFMLPTVGIAKEVMQLGSVSATSTPDKMKPFADRLFTLENFDVPFLEGVAVAMVVRRIPELYLEARYDMFIGEVVCAYADRRVFNQGRWSFTDSDRHLRTLHYVAGGQFYQIGEPLLVPGYGN